jgi:hypothetical protein
VSELARTLPGRPQTWFDGVVAAGNRLRFTLADQDGARQMVRASLPDVHGEALLLCGGERSQALRLTEATFAWLGPEIRRGRETVTLGRLQVVLRHHFLEELHPSGRRRRRARAAARALEATRAAIAPRQAVDVGTLLGDLPQLARAVAVLRHVDLLLLPDVAAALRMPEPIVAEIDALVREALAPLGGIPALRAELSAGPPPLALAGRVLAPLIEAVSPSYLAAPLPPTPGLIGDPDVGIGARARRGQRHLPGWAVALAIVAGLAAISAARQVAGSDPGRLPPAVPASCTTLAAATGPEVAATLPPVGGQVPLSPQPPAACPAP